MTEISVTSDTALPDAPGFLILNHYLVDLSVENPMGRLSDEYLNEIAAEHGVHVKVSPLPEGCHRVDIFVRLTARAGIQTVFVAELNYRADARLHQVPDQAAAEILHVQLPSALLPFIKDIFESNGRFAGYPGLQLHGLDFAAAFNAGRAPQ